MWNDFSIVELIWSAICTKTRKNTYAAFVIDLLYHAHSLLNHAHGLLNHAHGLLNHAHGERDLANCKHNLVVSPSFRTNGTP